MGGADTGAARVKRRVVGVGRSLLVWRHHAASAAVGLCSARTHQPAAKRRHVMGFQADLPAKRLRIPKVSARAGARERGPVREVVSSIGSSPPGGVIRGIPSACDLVPRSARGSLQVLAPRDVYSPTQEDMVLPMVRWLLNAGVVSIMDRNCPLRATCWPFIIPKTTEKVSLIFNLVDLNEALQKPASFCSDGWEPISHKLAEWPADRPLFCTHVDLKNAFWSFALPRRHARAFRFHLRWEGEDRIFCMSRMPFGWKHSPRACEQSHHMSINILPPPDWRCVVAIHLGAGYPAAHAISM